MVADPPTEGLFTENPSFGISYAQVLQRPAMSTPEEIARVVVFLASDASASLTSVQLPVDRGATVI